MKARSSRLASVLLTTVAIASPAFAQTVTLRYRWQQGDVLTYRTIVRTTNTASGAGGSQAPLVQTMTQTLKVTVAAVAPDGAATLRQTIDAVSVEFNGPMGSLVYDSAAPPAADEDPRVSSMAKTFGAMVGEVISVTMDPNGAIRRIDGAAKIVDKLMAGLPRDPMAGALAQNIKAMLGEDALRSSLEQSFSRLPDQPVKPGDTWTSQQSVGAEAVGRIIGTSTFTLKGVEGTGDAAIARLAVDLALKQESTPTAGASMVVTLGESKGTGEVLFDIAKGRIQRNSMATDMTSTVTRRGPDGTPATMRNNTKTSMTMDLVVK